MRVQLGRQSRHEGCERCVVEIRPVQPDELLRQLPDLFDVPLHVAERERMHGFGELPEGIAGQVRVGPALLGRQLEKVAGWCGLNSFVMDGSTGLSVPNRGGRNLALDG
jgi:hypothetical protein